jgi:hypothetical protein
MRAADDFAVIRARLEELRREREEEGAIPEDNRERIRSLGNVRIEDVRPRPYRTSLEW